MNGTIYNKDSFLVNLSKSLGRNEVPSEVKKPEWSFNPQKYVLNGATLDELVVVLEDQCKYIHTDFVIIEKMDLVNTLQEIVTRYGNGPIITWKDARFKEWGLSHLFQSIWPVQHIDVHEWDPSIGQINIEKANISNIGIVISDITLAESGTAVLLNNRNRGRSVSFLPASSIIIIPKSNIVPRMTQAAQQIRQATLNGEQIATCINFITGPSNSADIEMNLVVGVHGPVKATYIVVEDL